MREKTAHQLVAALAISGGIAAVTNAAVTLSFDAPNPSPASDNVLFDVSGGDGPGPLVKGSLNGQGGLIVNFFGAGEDLVSPSSGAARITASDGLFTDLTIALDGPDTSFTYIEFNPDVDNAEDDGPVTFTVNLLAGAPFVGSLTLDDNGQNRLFIQATGGDRITSVVLDSSVDLVDITQFRIGGAVPEPSSLAILAFSGLLLARRTRVAARQRA